LLDFHSSKPLTLGVELELQLVNRRDYNLTRASSDLLTRLAFVDHGYDIKPEITESMIEIATGIHQNIDTMIVEINAIKQLLIDETGRMNIGICGGGAHPFQHWDDQRIFKAERYRLVSELYGYLAKQFTVYGQHIHIGCPDGDTAIGLANQLSEYLPDFVALSASSPFYQGVDTLFASSRLTSVNAFPLSGRMPSFDGWESFCSYYDSMKSLGIVESMKDFYWDLRPKPEFGTIEIRICDCPLTVETSVLLAAYAQALACEYLETMDGVRPQHPMVERVHSYNRFQACRFGLQGQMVTLPDGSIQTLGAKIAATIDRLAPQGRKLGSDWALEKLKNRVTEGSEDSLWLRSIYADTGNLSEVVRRSTDLWAESSTSS
jgi:glutamate---cysteine ligase / carboxylate-amine ligase